MLENLIPIFFIAIVVVSIVGGMFYSHFAAKKRRSAMEEIAETLGLAWFPDGNAQQLSRHAGFNLFGQGRARKMQNLIEGITDEVQIGIFDYHISERPSRPSHRFRQHS